MPKHSLVLGALLCSTLLSTQVFSTPLHYTFTQESSTPEGKLTLSSDLYIDDSLPLNILRSSEDTPTTPANRTPTPELTFLISFFVSGPPYEQGGETILFDPTHGADSPDHLRPRFYFQVISTSGELPQVYLTYTKYSGEFSLQFTALPDGSAFGEIIEENIHLDCYEKNSCTYTGVWTKVPEPLGLSLLLLVPLFLQRKVI